MKTITMILIGASSYVLMASELLANQSFSREGKEASKNFSPEDFDASYRSQQGDKKRKNIPDQSYLNKRICRDRMIGEERFIHCSEEARCIWNTPLADLNNSFDEEKIILATQEKLQEISKGLSEEERVLCDKLFIIMMDDGSTHLDAKAEGTLLDESTLEALGKFKAEALRLECLFYPLHETMTKKEIVKFAIQDFGVLESLSDEDKVFIKEILSKKFLL